MAANGPASTREKSATRSPSSGPVEAVIGAEPSLPEPCPRSSSPTSTSAPRSDSDLLRRPELRAPLLEALEGVERLVILGDGFELRESAAARRGRARRAVLEDLGRALGPDGELVLVGGNHDHGLVAGWIDGRLQSEPPGFLGLEQRMAPEDAGPFAVRLAERAAPARVSVAYPGLWLRDDVYAIHGHYSDLHTTVPTFERLAAGAMARWVVHLPDRRGHRRRLRGRARAALRVDAHARPALARTAPMTGGAGASARAWVALAGEGRRAHPLRAAALGTGYAAAVACINAIGLGPIDRDLSGPGAAPRRARSACARCCGGSASPRRGCCSATRTAPARGRATTARSGRPPGGTQLINTGQLVLPAALPLRRAEPARPTGRAPRSGSGTSGPPELIRLLGDRGHDELRPPPRAAPA